jgi:hypothetical protein
LEYVGNKGTKERRKEGRRKEGRKTEKEEKEGTEGGYGGERQTFEKEQWIHN